MLRRRHFRHQEARPEEHAGDLTLVDLAILGCMKRMDRHTALARASRLLTLDMLANVSAATCWIPADDEPEG
jgi:hypothetical protein